MSYQSTDTEGRAFGHGLALGAIGIGILALVASSIKGDSSTKMDAKAYLDFACKNNAATRDVESLSMELRYGSIIPLAKNKFTAREEGMMDVQLSQKNEDGEESTSDAILTKGPVSFEVDKTTYSVESKPGLNDGTVISFSRGCERK